jgi:hypothetical protein
VNRVAVRAALWSAAQPGFALDSTWLVGRGRWVPIRTVAWMPPVKETEDDITFDILGIRSPGGRYTLNVDSYQLIELSGDSLEVGGDADSQSSLIDHRTRREAILQFAGTTGRFQWGAWLSPRAFAIGGYLDADSYSQWQQGHLWCYSIPDSTVTEYQTRIVSATAYERYSRAWRHWLFERYRPIARSRRPA